MLVFSTLLPIKDTLGPEEFIRLAIEWNNGSPHPDNVIPNLEWNGERNIRFGSDKLWMQIEEYRNENIIAIRYEKTGDEGIVWDTDYVMNFNEMKMSIRLDRGFVDDAWLMDLTVLSPVFVNMLMEQGYLQDDVDLPITWKPVFVDENNIQCAAKIINRSSQYRLPIVYVSKTFMNEDPVDIWDMAKQLKGIAHVLVQKNSRCGETLREMTDGKNEYNGAIGIYFSQQGSAHLKFLYHDYPGSRVKIAKKVIQRVLEYSTSQRMDILYTWGGVNNSLLRDRYSSKRAEAEEMRLQVAEALKEAKENEELVESTDEEIEEMQHQIEELTRHNDALTYENQNLRSKLSCRTNAPVLVFGEEEELYPDEIKDMILGVIKRELTNTEANTRRADVFGDILRSNDGYKELAPKRAEDLKDCLRGYKSLSSAHKKTLDSLGLYCDREDGGHYFVKYYGDGRYTATFAKSPSDHRTGLNIALDVIKDMF